VNSLRTFRECRKSVKSVKFGQCAEDEVLGDTDVDTVFEGGRVAEGVEGEFEKGGWVREGRVTSKRVSKVFDSSSIRERLSVTELNVYRGRSSYNSLVVA
jgi:hypothetical protein